MEIRYIEMRYDGKLIYADGIDFDGYANTTLTYNKYGDLTLYDLEDAREYVALYPEIAAKVIQKQPFNIETEAMYLPSIGKYHVEIKTINVE